MTEEKNKRRQSDEIYETYHYHKRGRKSRKQSSHHEEKRSRKHSNVETGH